MKIAVSQINYIIGNIDYNCNKIISEIQKYEHDVDLIIFSELSVTGYPPMDLLEHRKMIDENLEASHKIAEAAGNCAVLFGFIDRDDNDNLYNAAAFAYDSHIKEIRRKTLLPTYDVFDEDRYFTPASTNTPIRYKDVSIGITICEDIWNHPFDEQSDIFTDQRTYAENPVEELTKSGLDLLVNIAASPFVMGKNLYKRTFISKLAKQKQTAFIYCNQVGGNDSLLFDGLSFVCNKDGSFSQFASFCKEDTIVYDTEIKSSVIPPEEKLDYIEKALVMGVRDYMQKCGFKKAVLGLSGGIDSALTASLAVKAIGKDNVIGITMPSQYSSSGSVDDSIELAKNLGIKIEEIPIKTIYSSFNNALSNLFKGLEADVTEENLQARIRGTLLMAASNKFGAILLTTGNKSELAMGYCTLYGDMSGGLAVISDVPKTLVYQLANNLNREHILIPENTIIKPPSAELREDQKDEDSLPPYDILDVILKEYVENRRSKTEIIAMGYDPDTVEFILRTVDRNEYKRRQAAPGLKITTKAFGTGRRIPMAQGFKA